MGEWRDRRRGTLASLLALSPRQRRVALQLLTQSLSLPAHLPQARAGLSLQGVTARDTLISAPSLGSKPIPILHIEVPD